MINWEQNWTVITGTTYIRKYTDWNYANNVSSGETTSGLLTQYDVPIGSGDYTRLKQWQNINNLTGQTDEFAHYFNVNLYNVTLKEDSSIIILNDFNFSVPTGSTISGMQVKITKSSEKYHDLQGSLASAWVSDKFWYENNVYTYTYDTLVTIDTNSGTTTTGNTNNAIAWTPEQVSETAIGNQPWLTSTTDPEYRYLLPTGIWTEDKRTYVYGSETDVWGKTWDTNEINSSDLSIKIKVNQHVFKSYETIPTFRSSLDKENWENAEYTSSGYTDNTFGYMTSKLYDVLARVIYLEEQTGYYIIDRENVHTISNTLNIDNVYFNFQNCFNGICYNYINDIEDIYNISLLTGNNKTINNVYTEYNIINKYFKNLNYVDIAMTINVNLNLPYFKLDKLAIKPGQRILLTNQLDTTENDIYIVDENYYLQVSTLLSGTTKSEKAKFYVKLGTNTEKQYHLLNAGNSFPITGEPKTFVEKHSYIIKNKINYNIINTNTATTYDISDNVITTPCKILFTNYDVARSLKDNRTFYNSININLTGTTDYVYNKIILNYLNTEYSISDEYGEKVYYDFTGDTSTSGITEYSGHTQFYIDDTFSGRSNISDHVLITILTGTTTITDDSLIISSYVNYMTTIKSMTTEKLTISGQIPSYVLNDIIDGYTVRITNLHYCPTGMTNFAEFLNNSPYNELIYAIDLIDYLNISVKISDKNKYYDYNLLNFVHNTYSGETYTATTYNFTSNNQYIDYKLDTFLERLDDNLPINIYNENYLFSNQYTIEEVTSDFTGHTFTDTYYVPQSSMLKIIPSSEYVDKLNDFKRFTFIDYGILTTGLTQVTDNLGNISYITGVVTPYSFVDDTTGRTMIYDITDTYMLVEKPINYSVIKTNNYDIINVSKLTDISNILYDVYTNYSHDYYFKKSDNLRNCIAGQYGSVVRNNEYIRNISTGIIYCDNGEFNFDLFNLEVNDDFTHNDINLTYQPIELIDVGIDKITKLPIPITIDNLSIPVVTETVYYTGTTNLEGIYGAPHTITPKISVNNTLLYEDFIYINLNYEGIIHFDGTTTDYGNIYNQGLIQRNNAILVLSTGFTEEKMVYENLIGYDNGTSQYDYTNIFITLLSNRLNIDDSGITYNSGYFRVMNDYYYDDSYLKVDASTDLISKSKQNGYYITYNESFEKISGFTYSDTKSTLNYVRNVVSTSDNVYVTYQYTDLVIISFSPTSYSANGNGEIFPVMTTSVGPWVASETSNWLSLSNYNGNTGDIISITADVNTGITTRNYSIIFNVNNNIEYFVVNQPVQHRISINPESVLIQGDGNTGATLNVTSTYEWIAINNESWGRVLTTSGNITNIIDNVDSILIEIDDNITGYPRTGTTTFECRDVVYKATTTLTFYQDDSIVVSPSIVQGDDIRNGSTYPITITATDTWTSTESIDWLTAVTYSGDSGITSVELTISSNDSGGVRSGTSTFTCNSATFVLTVIQPVEDQIALSSYSVIPDGDGDAIDITVSSTYPWTLAESLDWVSATTYSGVSGDTVTFDISDNTTGYARDGIATFTCGIASTGLTINQIDSITAITSGEWDSLIIFRDGGSIEVEIISTGATEGVWFSGTTGDWITANLISGNTGDIITISGTSNDTLSTRTADITFSANTATHTITVLQYAESTISFVPNPIAANGNGDTIYPQIYNNNGWGYVSGDTLITYFNPTYGYTNPTPVTITVSANDTGSARTGYTWIYSGLKTASLEIYQAVEDGIWLSSYDETFDGDGETKAITVIASGETPEWRLDSILPSWITTDVGSGETGDSISITTTDNESGIGRIFELYFEHNCGCKSTSITLRQPDSIITLDSGAVTKISNLDFGVVGSGGHYITNLSELTQNIVVRSTDNWSSVVSIGSSWITRNPSTWASSGDKTVSITAAINSGSGRAGIILYTCDTATYSIAINQEPTYYLFLTSSSSINVDGSYNVSVVTVQSNTTWSVSDNRTWISTSGVAGSGNDSFNVTIQSNPDTFARFGQVYLTWAGTTITINVYQAASGDEPCVPI